MCIAVTGGAGYIGSVVTEVLLREGHNVLVVDNADAYGLGSTSLSLFQRRWSDRTERRAARSRNASHTARARSRNRTTAAHHHFGRRLSDARWNVRQRLHVEDLARAQVLALGGLASQFIDVCGTRLLPAFQIRSF